MHGEHHFAALSETVADEIEEDDLMAETFYELPVFFARVNSTMRFLRNSRFSWGVLCTREDAIIRDRFTTVAGWWGNYCQEFEGRGRPAAK